MKRAIGSVGGQAVASSVATGDGRDGGGELGNVEGDAFETAGCKVCFRDDVAHPRI